LSWTWRQAWLPRAGKILPAAYRPFGGVIGVLRNAAQSGFAVVKQATPVLGTAQAGAFAHPVLARGRIVRGR
jgi:hypothetical protein